MSTTNTTEKAPAAKGNGKPESSGLVLPDTNSSSGNGTVTITPVATEYAVYEIVTETVDAPAPDELKLVAIVTAASPTAARWTAVEASLSLKARVTAKEGKSGEEVNLLPIALRYLGNAAPTFEKVDLVIDRR